MCEVLAQVDPGSGSIGLLLLQISGFSIFPVPSSGATPKLPFHKAPIPLPFHYSEEAPMDINFLNIPPCSITSIFTPFLMVSFMSLRKRYSLSQEQSPNLCSSPCLCDPPHTPEFCSFLSPFWVFRLSAYTSAFPFEALLCPAYVPSLLLLLQPFWSRFPQSWPEQSPVILLHGSLGKHLFFCLYIRIDQISSCLKRLNAYWIKSRFLSLACEALDKHSSDPFAARPLSFLPHCPPSELWVIREAHLQLFLSSLPSLGLSKQN